MGIFLNPGKDCAESRQVVLTQVVGNGFCVVSANAEYERNARVDAFDNECSDLFAFVFGECRGFGGCAEYDYVVGFILYDVFQQFRECREVD